MGSILLLSWAHFGAALFIPWKQRNWEERGGGPDTDGTARKVGKVDLRSRELPAVQVGEKGRRVRRCRWVQHCMQEAVCRDQLMSCCCSGSLRPTSSQAARLLTAERSRAAFSPTAAAALRRAAVDPRPPLLPPLALLLCCPAAVM